MTAEQTARLDDIRAGPWREKSQPARQRLPSLSEPELQRYLRSHFGDEINDRAEIEFRESFDQALEELQLMELAIACNFLPLEVVRTVGEPEFATLLSSKPARAYVKLYDFVPVRYLASRLGIDLQIGDVQPPAVNPQAEVRYAVFLATHYEFIANHHIRTFTMFIDDFYFGDISVDSLKKRLAGKQAQLTSDEEAAIAEGCVGLIQFTETLGDFFLQVPVPEQRYFGLAYSYWLSHFFGLRRPRNRYEQLGVSFEHVQFDPALLVPELDPRGAESERQRFHDRVRTLKVVWDATRQLIDTLNGS